MLGGPAEGTGPDQGLQSCYSGAGPGALLSMQSHGSTTSPPILQRSTLESEVKKPCFKGGYRPTGSAIIKTS